MRQILRYWSAILLVYAALAAVPALGMESGTSQIVAAASCSSHYTTCVMRCHRDAPQDKACPSDHCVPKLSECKANGCWQEGRRYGGQLACNLRRG